MDELELIIPTVEYKEQVERYKKDMIESGSSMDGCGDLRKDDFETWLQKNNDWREWQELGIYSVLRPIKRPNLLVSVS